MTAHRLMMLKLNQLKTHPQNLRRFYPEKDVREMAELIKAHDGVLQALLIVPAEKKGVWYVVDGNLRLAGARLLGKDCPLLKCEPVDMDKGQQLLAMATTAFIRYQPDPVSEAMHFERLVQEGMSVRDISKHTGIYETKIRMRLKIRELDQPIQDHMAKGNLPHSERVCEALLSIPDKNLRIKLADRLAFNPNTTIRGVEIACRHVVEALKKTRKMAIPSLETVGLSEAGTGPGRPKGTVGISEIRSTARATCSGCDIKESQLRDAKEPAWSLITHLAGETCKSCCLVNVQTTCSTCPLTEFLRRVVPDGNNGRKT